MKRTLKMLIVAAAALGALLGCTVVAFAEEGDASYFIDEHNIEYACVNGTYVPCETIQSSIGGGSSVQPANVGFGESSASWRYSKTDNGYTAKHKGWKERKSSSSLYGVRACSTTVCTPSKRFWGMARTTTAIGTTITSSGQVYSVGTVKAVSPFDDKVHINNACMRSTWGDVGTVVSQW